MRRAARRSVSAKRFALVFLHGWNRARGSPHSAHGASRLAHRRDLALSTMNQPYGNRTSVAASRNRPSFAWIALGAVLVVGAALRFWNLTTGLPYRVGADEPVIAERAIHIMKTGSFNPHFYDYPGLYLYAQVIVGCAR